MTPASTMPTPAALESPFAAEVHRGLSARPFRLSPWLFYDEEGSQLFEAITRLPEYYLTRTERALFAGQADAIIDCAAAGQRLSILELGAGTATKTGLLLAAAVRRQKSIAYYPIDVSASALEEAQQHLEAEVRGVSVYPRVGNYTESLGRDWQQQATRKLVLYIGSSIGNFEPADAKQLLMDMRAQLSPGDALLIGADQAPHARKSLELLLAAYNDSEGITAAFNKNMLVRINRELGADFQVECFRHDARWNREQSRIEMHLVSLVAQRVNVPALDLKVFFSAGESIHTENSYKFSDARLAAILQEAGFTLSRQWKDEQEWFGVYLALAV